MNLSLVLPSAGSKLTGIDDLLDLGSEPRTYVFFDEEVDCYLMIESAARFQFESEVYVEISIIPSDLEDSDSSYTPQSFVIFTQKLEKDTPCWEKTDNSVFLTAWKLSIPLKYPKRKLKAPKVKFSCYIRDKATLVQQNSSPSLAEFVPSSVNLLQELNNQISQDTAEFYLSSRVIEQGQSPAKEHALPSPPESEDPLVASSLTLPIYSSLLIKLKSTKPAGQNDFLFVSINLESSETLTKLGLANYLFELINVDIEFASGKISHVHNIEFPLQMALNESLNLNYRLIDNDVGNNYSRPLNIRVFLRILDNEGQHISNVITTIWSPFIDFNFAAPPINSSLKSFNGKSNINIKKKSTSSVPNLPQAKRAITSSNLTVNLTNTSPSLGAASHLLDLRLTFNGKLNMQLGEIVNWKLQAINNSYNRLNLSLMVQKSQMIPNTLLATNSNQRVHNYNTYNLLKLDTCGVVILDNDLRIPLEPNSVYETTLSLIGVSKGIFSLDGLKLFELNSGEGIDIGKLVEVFVT